MKKFELFIVSVILALTFTGCEANKQPNDMSESDSSITLSSELYSEDDGTISSEIEATNTDSETEALSESDYDHIIDRVLNENKFTPVDWNSTIEWEKDADVVVKMAEDSTGRYEAQGIISKEAGTYGIILNDKIDGSDHNTNYILEPWYYTASSTDAPKFEWKDERLFLSYPAPNGNEYTIKTVQINCGYDTGHMEFKDEQEKN